MSYRKLQPDQIIETTRRLQNRVAERFPQAGLTRVCRELLTVADDAAKTSQWIDRPNVWLRVGIVFCILLIVGAAIAAIVTIQVQVGEASIFDILQGTEAAVNDIVFVAIAILFLLTWENRIKRNRALKALHELRALAHIIDMHQLTKDPERIMNAGASTASSPVRSMTAFELLRYLDYCSEMLSIISKIAAIYVQNYDDNVTLEAVNEIEDLTSGLSRKVWHKIAILDRFATRVHLEPVSDD